jgi:hypothetical protein
MGVIMEIGEALKKLRELYPGTAIKHDSKNNVVTKDGLFVAWTKDGEIDLDLLPELRDK